MAPTAEVMATATTNSATTPTNAIVILTETDKEITRLATNETTTIAKLNKNSQSYYHSLLGLSYDKIHQLHLLSSSHLDAQLL